jgi:hypothetical protein
LPKEARESVLLDSGGTVRRLDEPGFAGVCPAACPVLRRYKPQRGRGATAIHSRKRWRFVRKGLAPDTAREACCWTVAARRAPESGFTKIQFDGGAQKSTRNVERVVVLR